MTAAMALTAPVQTGTPSGSPSGSPSGVVLAAMSLRASLTPQRMALVIEEKRMLDDLIQQYLEEKVDYGTIPGTKKPTLYKAGAEKITYVYECYAQFEEIEREIDHDRLVSWTKNGRNRTKYSGESTGLYRYVYRCKIVHRASGVVVAEGYGAASTMESKYIDRPRECENTVLKMAKKRAQVDAVLSGFGLSERFTQDVEDVGVAAAEGHDAADDDAPSTAEQGPPVGSLEWARAYPIPAPVARANKLKVDAVGLCTWKEASALIESLDAFLKIKPGHEPTLELKRAATIYANALEDEAEERNAAAVAAESALGGIAANGPAHADAAPESDAAETLPLPAITGAPSAAKAVDGELTMRGGRPVLEDLPF